MAVGSFSAGLSGLNANSVYLNVIGNNLANINTIGFKSSAVTFMDLVSQTTGGSSINPMQVGLGVVTGIGGVAVAGLVRDGRQGRAHVAIHRVGRQERLRIHRIHVVDPVDQGRGDAVGTQRSHDHVEDDGPAEAPDVDGARRGLAVVDDLGAGHPRRQLIRPVHRVAPLQWVRLTAASESPRRYT